MDKMPSFSNTGKEIQTMLNANGVTEKEYLEYKGRPLFYGDMSEEFYIYMLIMSEKETPNGTIPDKLMVQLCHSKTQIPKEQKILGGFKEAFEYADAWLERYNK